MTPDDLKKALYQLYGNRQRGALYLSRDLEVGIDTVRDWLSGRHPISGPAGVAISLMLELRSQSKSRMTPIELREAMSKLWGDQMISRRPVLLGRALKVSNRTVEAWLSGRSPLAGPAKVAIDLLLKKQDLQG